ncbi:MAG TPA: M20/M25/M40 family metallo-hydrolase, partial [Bacteroidota bacterium]|nr:M20/M25/M40 family metallo-hydrolase [Bacteroidota bacterium]
MRSLLVHLISTLVVLPSLLVAQVSTPEITGAEMQTYIKYLASDELAGRGSGSPGNVKAAQYIANYLHEWGLQPAGDSGGYFQHFSFVSSVRLGASNALRIDGPNVPGGGVSLVPDVDFRPFGFSSNETVSGPLVFAGYGISAPDTGYDDFQNLDVKGKIVVVLRYSPDGTDPHSSLNRFSSFRNKARTARDNGARGLIIVAGPLDEPDDEIVKLSFDQAFASSGIPAISIRRAAIEPILAPTGRNLKSIQETIKATRKPVTFALPGVSATLTTDVDKVNGSTANVIGTLPCGDPAFKDQYLVLGAHLDHLGMGGPGSGSMQPDTVAVHHGADDNASGTAGLLELAQAFAAERSSLKRGLVFIFFSGEELGTLGSAYYVNNPVVPLSQTVAMLNMDMVGRLQHHSLEVGGTGTSTQWNGLLGKFNSDSTFALKMSPDGYGPSDHSQFYGKDIPVLFFFTGTHNDYHKPSDTWDKINYAGEEQVVRFVYKVAGEIDREADRPAFTRVASSAPGGGGDTRSFRVTLGIIPDYAEGVEGMKISGIRPGGPAEKAGLKSGDVIVRMRGKKIMNIYDYMGMLGELKSGDRVEVVVVRDGKEITVT